MMSRSTLLTVSIEASIGNGEDSYLTYEGKSENGEDTVAIGVFDGLGGRSAGFGGQKGGRIASTQSAQVAESLLKEWKGKLTQKDAEQFHRTICHALKLEADANMPVSRLKGTLAGKRLCTTLALASVSKYEQNSFKISLAWMGDSRIYFLGEQYGLQQLTRDDLEVKKDAFEMIREDPPMSQYITADTVAGWRINYSELTIEERGCVLACTDGCFQYLSTPWDFERLLLETLSSSNSIGQWEDLLTEKYQQIKQDDVSLLVYPIGFSNSEDIEEIKGFYKSRSQTLDYNYSRNINDFDGLIKLWSNYRIDYESRLTTLVSQETQQSFEIHVSGATEEIDIPVDEDSEVSERNKTIKDRNNTDLESVVSKKIDLPDFVRDKPNSNGDNIDYSASEFVSTVPELCDKASRLTKLGKVEEAVQIYNQILSTQPYNIDVNYALGVIYSDLCNFKNTAKYLEIVHNLQNLYGIKTSYFYDSLIILAEAYYRINRFKDACMKFEQFVQISHSPLSELNMELYANALRKSERYEEAISICDEIKRKNPNNPFAFYIHGDILHQQNSLKDAERYLYFARAHFRREFERTRSRSILEWLKRVESEYRQVREKLDS